MIFRFLYIFYVYSSSYPTVAYAADNLTYSTPTAVANQHLISSKCAVVNIRLPHSHYLRLAQREVFSGSEYLYQQRCVFVCNALLLQNLIVLIVWLCCEIEFDKVVSSARMTL